MENNLFIPAFDLQSHLFTNTIVGVNGANDTKRINDTNHLSWVAGHLVSTRHLLGNVLGVQTTEKYAELFANRKGLDTNASYPALADLQHEWNQVTAAVRPKIAALNEEVLNSPAPFPTPVAEESMAGFIKFILHHEAYHIGQMSLLRRQLGYPAMSYR
jgi:uncharacterized damage-inducible protein DinB